jgi:uncharacterized membrane protein
MPKRKTTILTRFIHFLWSLFLNGLFTILPLTLTAALTVFSFKLIVGWLEPLHTFVENTIFDVPYSEVILIIVFIFLIGAVLKLLILRPIIHALEALIARIPLIRPIYAGIKQLVDAFSIQNKITFKQVVLVEFPRKGLYSLAFLTSELPQEIAPNNVDKFFNIFIPTTPNPTSGYFIILPEQDITRINISRQEAMAMIISGGIIQPESLFKK